MCKLFFTSVHLQDEERGGTVMVACMPLATVLLAANVTSIDLLTIATGVDGDENRIAEVLNSRKFDVKVTILFLFPYVQVPWQKI